MNKLLTLLLACAGSAFAQNTVVLTPSMTAAPPAATVTVTYSIQGSLAVPVAAFAPLGACQPGPAPTFPPCSLPTASLGVAYSGKIPTTGLVGPITCALAGGSTLPAWATLSVDSTGLACVVSGTPTNTTPLAFSLTATGQ